MVWCYRRALVYLRKELSWHKRSHIITIILRRDNSQRMDQIMKRIFTVGIIFAAVAFSAAAQDWYHDREERFRGEGWRPSVFLQVRTDLEHVWSAVRASDKERNRPGEDERRVDANAG